MRFVRHVVVLVGCGFLVWAGDPVLAQEEEDPAAQFERLTEARARLGEPDHLVEFAEDLIRLRATVLASEPTSDCEKVEDQDTARTSFGLFVIYTTCLVEDDAKKVQNMHYLSLSHDGAALPICQAGALVGYAERVLGLRPPAEDSAAQGPIREPDSHYQYSDNGVTHAQHSLDDLQQQAYRDWQPVVPDPAEAALLYADAKARTDDVRFNAGILFGWSMCCESARPASAPPPPVRPVDACRDVTRTFMDSGEYKRMLFEAGRNLRSVYANGSLSTCDPLPAEARLVMPPGLEVTYRVTSLRRWADDGSDLHQIDIAMPGCYLPVAVGLSAATLVERGLGLDVATRGTGVRAARVNGEIIELSAVLHEKNRRRLKRWKPPAETGDPWHLSSGRYVDPVSMQEIAMSAYHRPGDFLWAPLSR